MCYPKTHPKWNTATGGEGKYCSVNTGYVIQEWSRQSWCLALMANSFLKVLSPSASRKAIVFHYRFFQNDTKWFGEFLRKLKSQFDRIKMKLWYIITNTEFAAFLASLAVFHLCSIPCTAPFAFYPKQTRTFYLPISRAVCLVSAQSSLAGPQCHLTVGETHTTPCREWWTLWR